MRRAKLFTDDTRKEHSCDVFFHGYDHTEYQGCSTWALIEKPDGTLIAVSTGCIQFIDPPEEQALTPRLQLAGMAMQGILASEPARSILNENDIALVALVHADVLIAKSKEGKDKVMTKRYRLSNAPNQTT